MPCARCMSAALHWMQVRVRVRGRGGRRRGRRFGVRDDGADRRRRSADECLLHHRVPLLSTESPATLEATTAPVARGRRAAARQGRYVSRAFNVSAKHVLMLVALEYV